MKFHFILVTLLALSSCSSYNKRNSQDGFLKVLHYNIKELDTKKLEGQSKQLTAVKNIVNKFDFDILSINEIQYDLPSVPNPKFKTKGENLDKLAKFLGLKNYRAVFFQANTGNNAKKKADGNYIDSMKDKRSRNFADQDNFGIYPGQYSTGVLLKSDIEIIDIKSFSSLRWKDFNKKLNLSKFKTASGAKVNPEIELFDKNFTHITAIKEETTFNIILLHTVPAYHFGNNFSVNYERNADQLRFLEWYLTGKTDFLVSLKDISPLEKDAKYIAIGDWNTELSNDKNPGSKVLRNLKEKSKFWLNEPIAHTNESGSYASKRLKLQLDYISFSKHFSSIHSGIFYPKEQRKELGCKRAHPGEDVRTYFDRDKSKKCYVRLSKDFIELKEASDHFPIWTNLIINN